MGWGDSQQADLEANPNYVRLMKAFRLFDKNGDGFIDAAELKDLLLRVNPKAHSTNKLTEEDCRVIIKSFDENGDGKLDIEELVAAWSTIGGSDEDLDAAMKERREFKAAALKKKQDAAASMATDTKGEFQAKFMKPASGLTDTRDAAPSAAPLDAAMASKPKQEKEEPIVTSAPEASGPAASGPAWSAMDRARAKAAAKVGKDVEEGAGSLAAHKAKEDPANMTAAERAKAKAKEEVAKKEARKSVLKAKKAAEVAA